MSGVNPKNNSIYESLLLPPDKLFSADKKDNNKIEPKVDKSIYTSLLLPDELKVSKDSKQSTSEPKVISFNDLETRDTHLENLISQTIKDLGMGDASVSLTDISTGKTASVNGNNAFYPASIIKLAVMAEVFHQASEGKIDLNKIVSVPSSDVAPTWQPENDHRPCLTSNSKLSVRELVNLMITRSDNTATNTLIDLLGRQNITNYMKNIGLENIQVHRKLSVDNDSHADGRNTMNANETTKLLSMIAKGELVDSTSSKEMMKILGGQFDNDKIPKGLPKNSKVYHKTGETSKTTHDAAIIETGGKTYILTVFTHLPPGGNTYDKIAKLTSKINQNL